MKTKEAQKWLEEAAGEAEKLLSNPKKIDELLIQLEEKLREVPAIGSTLANLPTMIALVKAWITKEYTEISPKVIACLVGSILYLLKKKDLIDDRIPVIGIADDLAVMGLALNLSEPELNAFRAWRDNQKQETVPVQEVNQNASVEG